jgi:ubiquinone/menaquinone biosynthesis C-methylase UbiE
MQRQTDTAYPILPAAGFNWLTPFYDFFCTVFGLGRRFQQDVLTRLELVGNERLLDIGCGTGQLLAKVRRRYPDVTAVGVDADPAVLRIAQHRLAHFTNPVDLRTARAEALPLEDDSFDVAVSTLTFHHLPTEAKQAALREAHRVLRPSGRLLLVDFGTLERLRVPWWHRLIERAEYLVEHIRGRLPSLMAEAGFINVRRLHRRWPAVEYWAGDAAGRI